MAKTRVESVPGNAGLNDSKVALIDTSGGSKISTDADVNWMSQ
jgi:hypothetical protein